MGSNKFGSRGEIKTYLLEIIKTHPVKINIDNNEYYGLVISSNHGHYYKIYNPEGNTSILLPNDNMIIARFGRTCQNLNELGIIRKTEKNQ